MVPFGLRHAVQNDDLGLQIMTQALAASLAPEPGLLESAERQGQLGTRTVLADRARANSAGQRIGAFDVAGEYRGVESVHSIVGDFHRVLLVISGNDGQHGAENLLPADRGIVVDHGEQSWLDKVPSRQLRWTGATRHQS